MRHLPSSVLALGLIFGLTCVADTKSRLADLPLSFEANQGQADAAVKFLSRGPDFTALLGQDGLTLAGNRSHRILKMKLAGANPGARIEALDVLPGITNYFIGNDPKKWRARVPNYARIAVREVYPGIDLLFYGNHQRLEYDVVVAPGADPARVRVVFEGADRIRRQANGDLAIRMGDSEIIQRKPLILQDGSPVSGGYSIHGKEIAFSIPRYNKSKKLVIDPSFFYSTYLGGTVAGSAGQGNGITVDANGNTYIVASASSGVGWPLVNASQSSFANGGGDAYIAKINPQGSGFVYATYFGGPGYDNGLAIAADLSGAAYITGSAEGGLPAAPTSGPNAYHGNGDAYLAKFDPTGLLVLTAYIGGNGNDQGNGVGVDSNGNAFVAGVTSGGLNVLNAAQTTFGGGTDAFVAKLSVAGDLQFLTYLGGSGNDQATGLAIDSAGAAYISGDTTGNFPVASALQGNYGGGASDAFVAKFSSSGARAYATYLGGSGRDSGKGIAVDSAGSAYVTGSSDGNFPVMAAYQATIGGGTDAFITKLSPSGSSLVYSTYLGGTLNDIAYGIAVDSSGNALITGSTDGAFPGVTGSAIGGGDAFVASLNAAGTALNYSIYLGGSATDYAFAIATDVNGTAYVTGETQSVNFPQVLPIENSRVFLTSPVAFVTAIARGSSSAATLGLQCAHGSGFFQNAVNVPFTLTISNLPGSPATSGTVTVTDILPSGFTLNTISGTGWNCTSNNCSRSDSLAGNASYPPITVNVNVPSNAPSLVTNMASAFGGGSTAVSCTDSTPIGTTQNTPTFGSFDTPIDQSMGINGAIAVTGWALDPISVSRVDIYRDTVPTDATPNSGSVFIGTATFVPGARPDVQATYPSYPNANRAGWGYLLLTNQLPNSDGSAGLGNGLFRLHAIATNASNITTELGTGKSFYVDNLHAVTPFGTIDTPSQGGTASGTQFVNFGWALTPGAFMIPTDGSTITVMVDGVSIGHPVYNQFRSDIATTFGPAYSNYLGAVGFKIFDTTQYLGGLHTIGWLVADNGAHAAGIGSRYFTIQNGSTNVPEDAAPIEKVTGVSWRHSLDLRAKPQVAARGGLGGPYRIEVEELDMFEIHVGAASGVLRVNGTDQSLPVGSTLKGGVFYWQLAPGFLGKYDLEFAQPDGARVPVQVQIVPKRFTASAN